MSRGVVVATLEDALHFTPSQRVEIEAAYEEYERDARIRGIPIMGEGRIFTVPEAQFVCPPMVIPKHWPRICGIDFGFDHPFAAVWLAWDRESDCIYVYDCWRSAGTLPALHVHTIRTRGAWIPVAWPADGLGAEKSTGASLLSAYRGGNNVPGLELCTQHAQWPRQTEDEAEQSLMSVERGILEMRERLAGGRWRVFSHCGPWLDEYRTYHRKNGKIVKLQDDTLSASRYGLMMIRYALTPPVEDRPTAPFIMDSEIGF